MKIVKPRIVKLRAVKSPGDGHEFRALVACPYCKGLGWIDDDQYHGRVSIDCNGCAYHETHDLTKETVA